MSDLKLKDLRYLVAVADTRHFGRAAAKCFVSQPTLSAQLRKLELYLGVQLIERRPRHVTLTAAGEEITARARTMLESADAIVGLAQTRRDPLAGQLRMALLPTIGPYLLPLVALKMRKALPRLELMLYEYQTEPMLERLHNGDIDLGILALPVHVEDSRPARCTTSRSSRHCPPVTRWRRAPAFAPRISRARRCCCWRTATACATRRWRSAAAAACRRNRIFAPPASRPCARWSPPAPV
jgi:DNA-binding transcriptional LysR family regulator